MQDTTTLPTYLFATVEKRELNDVLNELKEVDYIHWFGSTTGRYDIVAAFKGDDMQKTYAAVKKIRSISGIRTTTSLVPFEGQVNPQRDGEQAMGLVFIGANRPVQDVIQSLKKISGVTEALVVAGQWDVLATVRGQSYEDLLSKTVREISQVDGIRTSETSFVYKPIVSA